MMRAFSGTAILLTLAAGVLRGEDLPKTVAESSEYRATSKHQDVVAFCDRLVTASPLIRRSSLGTSQEGRELPLLIVADPPIANPAEAARSGKLIVFAMGNIHAGEVDGKEALLMLARDLATAPNHPLLKDLIFVFAPIFNADGNEKISKANRTEQAGPVDGVGVRANAQGFDLNRDFIKLESPEVRALVRFLNEWDPAVIIDCHTTNGSYHRYTMTYEGGRCPAGDAPLITFVRDRFLSDVTRRFEKASGYHAYFYGNFAAGHSRWETVSPEPRFGTHYVGLRNRIAVLSESYSYAPFKDRVRGSYELVKAIAEQSAENKEQVRRILNDARDRSGAGGKDPMEVILRHRDAPVGRPHELLGYVEKTEAGRHIATSEFKTYEVQYWGGTEATLAVRRPYAYLIPAKYTKVIENLQSHGIKLEKLRTKSELDIEPFRVDKISRAAIFQKHLLLTQIFYMLVIS